VLFGFIAIAYCTSADAEAKAFSRQLFVGLAALIFFGIGVDMLHVMVTNPIAAAWMGVIEDGGEMVVGSVLTYMVVKHALAFKTPGQIRVKLVKRAKTPEFSA
jgi:hypothetical protein